MDNKTENSDSFSLELLPIEGEENQENETRIDRIERKLDRILEILEGTPSHRTE